MNKKITFIITILFILPLSIKADCTTTQISRYKALASHINNYYEFNEETKKFNIIIYNINSELSIENKNNKTPIQGNNQGQINIDNLNPGQTVTLSIYPTNEECSIYKSRTIYVNLPYYNNYYNDSICKNNNNKLCSKWANTSMYNHEQFVQKLKTETSGQQSPTKPEKEKIKNKYGFFDFLADYYILILLMIIASGSYGIYVLDKKSKFDF